jgi:hypothetical protein
MLAAEPKKSEREPAVMSLDDVKALTFDTGGTILDWHTGFSAALAETGAGYGVEKDWPALANELRRRSLKRMLNLGESAPPAYNFDDSHRTALDEILAENGLDAVTAEAPRSRSSASGSSSTPRSATASAGTPSFRARRSANTRSCPKPT